MGDLLELEFSIGRQLCGEDEEVVIREALKSFSQVKKILVQKKLKRLCVSIKDYNDDIEAEIITTLLGMRMDVRLESRDGEFVDDWDAHVAASASIAPASSVSTSLPTTTLPTSPAAEAAAAAVTVTSPVVVGSQDSCCDANKKNRNRDEDNDKDECGGGDSCCASSARQVPSSSSSCCEAGGMDQNCKHKRKKENDASSSSPSSFASSSSSISITVKSPCPTRELELEDIGLGLGIKGTSDSITLNDGTGTSSSSSVVVESTPIRTRLKVSNLCCEMETAIIKKRLDPLKGVDKVAVNVVGRIVYVTHNPAMVPPTKLCDILNEVHLGATLAAAASKEETEAELVDVEDVARVTVSIVLFVAGCAGYYGANDVGVQMGFMILLIILAAIGSVQIACKAKKSLFVQGRLDVNCLMLMAVCGAFALQEFVEAAAVVVVFVAAEMLEKECMRKVRNALNELAHSDTDSIYATLASDGATRVLVVDLKIGDKVCTRAGDRISVDGLVVTGKASVDESSLTGEPKPVKKKIGSNVSSGTLMTNGYLEIEINKPPSEYTTSALRQMVEEAQASTSPTQEAVTKFAAIFMPMITVAALLVAIIPIASGAHPSVWVERALILLVIACPCALILAAPIASVSSIGAAAKRGVLVKSTATLETLAAVNTVATDKTGTLTQGRCRVVSRHNICSNAQEAQDALHLAASLETRSTHPLASAIINTVAACIGALEEEEAAALFSDNIKDFKVEEGLGVRGIVDGKRVTVGNARFCSIMDPHLYNAHGATTIFVSISDVPKLALNIADPLRPEAHGAYALLCEAGVSTTMLTGDQPEASQAAADELMALHAKSKSKPSIKDSGSVDNRATLVVRASLKPQDKLKWVRDSQFEGKVVCMLGDGINDAPALAAADVGVAMGAGGTAMAVAAADVAIMSDNLVRLPEVIALAKYTKIVILQNIFLSVIIKFVVIIVTFASEPRLWLAVLADVLSLILVVVNGVRPLSFFEEEEKEQGEDECEGEGEGEGN